LAGSTSSIILPTDGGIIGEVGIVFEQLATNEAPSRVFAVLSGRPSSANTVHWDSFIDDFYVRVYSANTNTGYLAYQPYIAEFRLGRPVDSNGVEVSTVVDTNNTLPNLPTYAIVNSLSDYLQNRGYWMAFKLTSQSNNVDATTSLIPQSVLDLTHNDPDGYVFTLHVKTVLSVSGGIRISSQFAGHGQGPLRQGVFEGANPRSYIGDPAEKSYALGLEIAEVPSGEPGQTNVPVLVSIAPPWTGTAGLTAANLLTGQTNAVAEAIAPAAPWQTSAVFIATGETHTVQVPATNAAAVYRIEHGP